jgi:GNAT superfamily N-acetyltransferase
VAIISGIPSPPFNGVWCEGPDVPAATIEVLIDEVADFGVPFFLESRPVNRALAAERGLVLAGETSLMVLDAEVGTRVPRTPGGVSVRRLAPREAPVHARLVSAVHGLPEDAILQMVSEDALSHDWFRCYVAEVDGQPVATGAVATADAYASISNMATLPAFRRRGIGTAITAQAIADGHAAGARYCCLRSTADGLDVYRALGFEVVETWSQWVWES